MNLVTKTKPWMIASLLAATSAFGQTPSCAPKGTQVCKPAKCGITQAMPQPTTCAYNAPAEINIGMQGEIDFFAVGSFIYWQPVQDNMVVGTVYNTAQNTAASFANGAVNSGNDLEFNYRYKPGFEVALGMNLQDDDWVGYAKYTRVHGTHTTSSTGASAGSSIYPAYLSSNVVPVSVYSAVSADFTCNLDLIDTLMERVYYVGRHLVFHSAMGARAAFIKEAVTASYTGGATSLEVPATGATLVSNDSDAVQRVHSWGVGPEAGIEMDWMLGDGVRFFGSYFMDVLYTKYKVQGKEVVTGVYTPAGGVASTRTITRTTLDRPVSLRAHLDTELGFGWGSYFDNNAWYLDLSASYGFQVFFNQNMFSQTLLSPQHAGNLYVHGLTATARVDF